VGKLLVHVATGPEHPTRAALAFLVAAAAVDSGHDVSVFLAGDGVQLLRPEVRETLQGLGTGSLAESFDAVVAAGGRIYASGNSSRARGVGEETLAAAEATPSLPATLVELVFEHERVLSY
jgi:predicted peroxiredoxin